MNSIFMAAVSVKRSIVALILLPYKGKNDTLVKDGDPQKPYPVVDRERRFPKHPYRRGASRDVCICKLLYAQIKKS